ncbi:hypothetical protein D3C87_2111870 [compost metagenome]
MPLPPIMNVVSRASSLFTSSTRALSNSRFGATRFTIRAGAVFQSPNNAVTFFFISAALKSPTIEIAPFPVV